MGTQGLGGAEFVQIGLNLFFLQSAFQNQSEADSPFLETLTDADMEKKIQHFRFRYLKILELPYVSRQIPGKVLVCRLRKWRKRFDIPIWPSNKVTITHQSMPYEISQS